MKNLIKQIIEDIYDEEKASLLSLKKLWVKLKRLLS